MIGEVAKTKLNLGRRIWYSEPEEIKVKWVTLQCKGTYSRTVAFCDLFAFESRYFSAKKVH